MSLSVVKILTMDLSIGARIRLDEGSVSPRYFNIATRVGAVLVGRMTVLSSCLSHSAQNIDCLV